MRDFIAFGHAELAEQQDIPDAEFTSPSPAVLDALRTEFPEKYPNLEQGVRLRRFKRP